MKKISYLQSLSKKIHKNLVLNLNEKKKLVKVNFFDGRILRVFFKDIEYGDIKVSIYFALEGKDLNEFVFISIINDHWGVRSKGYHRIVIERMLKTIKKEKKLKKIRVVFVRRNMKNFWFGNGFIRSDNSNSIREFVYSLDDIL